MRWSLARTGMVHVVGMLVFTPFAFTTGVAQQAERIPWSVIASGGTIGASAGSLMLSGTLGQPAIGSVSDDQRVLYQGFWYPRTSISSVARPGDVAVAGGRAMLRNYPNPFSGSTTIAYTLGQRGRVKLQVFDLMGREVRLLHDGEQEPGTREIIWDGLDVQGREASSGSYLYVITVDPIGSSGDGFSERRMMVLVR